MAQVGWNSYWSLHGPGPGPAPPHVLGPLWEVPRMGTGRSQFMLAICSCFCSVRNCIGTMYTYIYLYIPIYTYIYLYILIYTYIYLYIYLYIPIYIYIGHRFVHQSGLDESSGQKSTTFRYRTAFRVYLMFSQIGKNTKYWQIFAKIVISTRACRFSKNKAPAASLKRRKWGLGLPIHAKMSWILVNLLYYTILVLNNILYSNCIGLAIVPSWVE